MPKRKATATSTTTSNVTPPKKQKVSKPKYRWGIIGSGKIAKDFAVSLQHVGAEIVAVGARQLKDAKQFGQTFSISNCYGTYEEVVKDPNVDIVYVSTIHPTHYDCVKLALENKKHVLCEKPFTLNSKQAGELIEMARKNKLYLQEASKENLFERKAFKKEKHPFAK